MSTDRVDAAELLLRLSIFGFSQLSATDQLQETEEVRNKLVHQGVLVLEQIPEESEEDFRVRTFTELFKELPSDGHDLLLSKVVKICKREGELDKLISWFSTQLDFKEQQKVIGKMVNVVHQGVLVLEQLPEESQENFRVRTFTELFKKLPFHEHDHFLSKVTKKFKRERQFGELISWFSTQLDSNEQEEVIRKIVNVTADSDETTDEDAILGRFSQLSRDYTDSVHKLLVPCIEEHRKKRKDKQKTAEEETRSDWQSRFDEFFFGFSIVWFKGQSTNSLKWLTKHPNYGRSVKGPVGRIIDLILRKESEKDFSELLCTKAFPFGIQVCLIDIVEEELRESHLRREVYDYAADRIMSYLLIFGFSLLSTIDQQRKIKEIQRKIKEMYNRQEVAIIKRPEEESEEDFRMRMFASQVHKVEFHDRAAMLSEVSKKIFCERKLHDLTLLFRQLGSNNQNNLIEQLFDWLMETYYSGKWSWEVYYPSKYTKYVIIEKLSEESEEDFRLRRFIKLCTTHPSLWDQNEVEKWDLTSMLQTSGNREINKIKHEVIWFKTRCPKKPSNAIQVLLSEAEEGDTTEKLHGENEEDFRLRRFIETFNQLQVSSQEYIVKYILRTLGDSIYGYRKLIPTAEAAYDYASTYWFKHPSAIEYMLNCKRILLKGGGGGGSSFEEDLPFALEFMKVKMPNLRGGGGGGGVGGTTAQGGGATAVTQGR